MLAAAALLAACGLLPPRGEEAIVELWPDLACRAVPTPPGPEDLVIDAESGVAWIAATDRRAITGHRAPPADGRIGHLLRLDLEQTEPEPEIGHLLRLDLEQTEPEPADVTPPPLRSARFHPQGLDLWRGPEGVRLLVTDRRHDYDAGSRAFDACTLDNAVHVLEVATDGPPTLLATLADPAMVRINDVAATGPETFVLTNDHGARSCWQRNLRDLFGHNQGHLLHVDGTGVRVAATGLPFANGVVVDHKRRSIHVASSQDGAINSFALEPGGAFEPAHRRALATAPDNLTLLGDGRLLVAAHPDRWRFLAYSRGWFGVEAAPSQLLVIDPDAPEAPPREIFADDGARLPAASIAATYDSASLGLRRLLLGAVFADRLLLCDQPLTGSRTRR